MMRPQLFKKFVSDSDLYILKTVINSHGRGVGEGGDHNKNKEGNYTLVPWCPLRGTNTTLSHLSFQVQLLHFLVTISYSNKCTWLRLLFRTTITLHLFFFFLPSTAHKIHTRRRAKKPEAKQKQKHAIRFKKALPCLEYIRI